MKKLISKYTLLSQIFSEKKDKQIIIITGSIDAFILEKLIIENENIKVFLTCYCKKYIDIIQKYPLNVSYYSRFANQNYKDYFIAKIDNELIVGKIESKVKSKQLFSFSSSNLISNTDIFLLHIKKSTVLTSINSDIDKFLDQTNPYSRQKLALMLYKKDDTVFTKLVLEISKLLITRLNSINRDFKDEMKNNEEIKDLIEKTLVENLKLKIKKNKLLLVLTTNEQEIEDIKQKLEKLEKELESIEQKNITTKARTNYFLNNLEKNIMKQDFKQSIKIIHPDIVSNNLRSIAGEITGILNTAYLNNENNLVADIYENLKVLKDDIKNNPSKTKPKLVLISLMAKYYIIVTEEFQELSKLSKQKETFENQQEINEKLETLKQNNVKTSIEIDQLNNKLKQLKNELSCQVS